MKGLTVFKTTDPTIFPVTMSTPYPPRILIRRCSISHITEFDAWVYERLDRRPVRTEVLSPVPISKFKRIFRVMNDMLAMRATACPSTSSSQLRKVDLFQTPYHINQIRNTFTTLLWYNTEFICHSLNCSIRLFATGSLSSMRAPRYLLNLLSCLPQILRCHSRRGGCKFQGIEWFSDLSLHLNVQRLTFIIDIFFPEE